MTMDDIRAMDADWITPATAASVLHMDPGRLIGYAKNGQFPVACRISGNRVLVSRKSLLETYGFADPEEKKTTAEELMAQILEELKAIREELMSHIHILEELRAIRDVLKGRAAG